jgi:site-specific DNA-methyltransferase (adenine-specific)
VTLDQFVHADCLDAMRELPDEVVDLVVTSPPWDRLRTYGGGNLLTWDKFGDIADQLFRITKTGGVICWHWQDQTQKGFLSGTGSRMHVRLMDVEFSPHCVIVIPIRNFGGHKSYVHPQFVYVMSKGRPKTVRLIRDRLNKRPGYNRSIVRRAVDGVKRRRQTGMVRSHRARDSVWPYDDRYFGATEEIAQRHPCPMHERLAQDLIYSWSKEGDLVLDPFAGAATTLKVASLMGRHYLGYEIVEEYWRLGSERLRRHVGIAS